MKRLALAVALVPTLLLAACGGTACSSSPAPLPQSSNTSCTLAAGSTANIQVELCGKCTDTTPACQAEFTSAGLEVAPTVQQCQENAGCNIAAGCEIQSPHATCTVTIPSNATGTYPIVIVGDTQMNGQLTIGSGTNCSLL